MVLGYTRLNLALLTYYYFEHMANNNKDASIGASPLLQEGTAAPKKGKANSTVHPDKLEQKRFTERRAEKDDGSPVRILIYFVIVVALGAGAALLIRTLISENDTEDGDDTEVVSEPVEDLSAYDINKTELADVQAENIPTLEDVASSSLVSVGSGSTEQNLSEIEYRNYVSFDRLTFKFDSEVPSTEITLNTAQDTMSATFPAQISVADDLQNGVTVLTLLDEIEYDATFNSFAITFSDAILYRVSVEEANLVIDFSTEEALTPQAEVEETEEPDTQEEEEEPAVEEEQTSNDSTPRPEGVTYENDFSQNTQFIVSEVTENTIGQDQYYFYDEGTYFEFSFGANGKVGDDYVPNSEARIETEDGTTYIYWTVENLSSEALAVYSRSQVTSEDLSQFITMSGANFVSIERLSFENGKAEYKIQLKNNADFSLVTQKSFDQSTQLLSILIKD